MIHSDERRTLIDWGDGNNWKTCKTIIIHGDSMELGNHYHKNKDERFMLVSGSGFKTLDGKRSEMVLNESVDCLRGVMHTFELSKGSILIGLCTEEFNPDDDFKQPK